MARKPTALTESKIAYCKITDWMAMTGMGRRTTYELLGNGSIRAVKLGTSTLVDVAYGLEYLRNLPIAQIKPMSRS